MRDSEERGTHGILLSREHMLALHTKDNTRLRLSDEIVNLPAASEELLERIRPCFQALLIGSINSNFLGCTVVMSGHVGTSVKCFHRRAGPLLEHR